MKKAKTKIFGFLPFRKAAKPAAGFSIIELMIVVGIIGLMSAIAVPNFTNMISRSRLRSAAGDLIREVQIAKLRAVSRNQTCAVIVQINAGSPGGVYLICCTGDPPAYPSGSLTKKDAETKFYFRKLGGDYAKIINIESVAGHDAFVTSTYCPVDVINLFSLPSDSDGILVNNFGRVTNITGGQITISLQRYSGAGARGARTLAINPEAATVLGSEIQP